MRTTKELSSVDSPNILLEFLQIIMDQFKRIIETHKFILESFKKKYQSNYVYDLKEVWLKIEIVVCFFFQIYSILTKIILDFYCFTSTKTILKTKKKFK